MKSSWRIGRIADIDVHFALHLLLPGWVALSRYLQRQKWSDALGGFEFTLSLFTNGFPPKSSQMLERGAEERKAQFDHAVRCDPQECRV
jgi:hypothetical protein